MANIIVQDSFVGVIGTSINNHAPDIAPTGVLWVSAPPQGFLFAATPGIVPDLSVGGSNFNVAQLAWTSPDADKVFVNWTTNVQFNTDNTANNLFGFGFGALGVGKLFQFNLQYNVGVVTSLVINYFDGSGQNTLLNGFPLANGDHTFAMNIDRIGNLNILIDGITRYSGSVGPLAALETTSQNLIAQDSYSVTPITNETYEALTISIDPHVAVSIPITSKHLKMSNSARWFNIFGNKAKCPHQS